MALKLKKSKKIKNQFVLTIGDEGAILVFFKDGKLENRIFVDSPLSPDVKLLERLFSAYPRVPISLLVDVIEQNYLQQFLPPVSAFGVRQQIQRKMKRDFQPNDLNNVLPLGRETQGRKDWNFLFISLANTDPFARWLDFLLNQPNKFIGVYLLPVESTKLISALGDNGSVEKYDWEILVLHNKTGGFRIVVMRGGKLIFTRLAQNIVGENIPDIIVGNLEQEVANTVEYLKRIAFKGEQGSRLTIIAATEVLQRIEPRSFKFGKVELLTPHVASERLGLPEAVNEKDKFSDILSATHFASESRHVLRFSSPFTKKLEQLYLGIRAAYAVSALIGGFLIFTAGSEVVRLFDLSGQEETIDNELMTARAKLKDLQEKEARLPSDYKKMQEILEISRIMPKDKYSSFKVLSMLSKVFGTNSSGTAQYLVSGISYTSTSANSTNNAAAPAPAAAPAATTEKDRFEMFVDVDFMIVEAELDRLENYVTRFETELVSAFPGYKVEIVNRPTAETNNKFQEVNTYAQSTRETRVVTLSAKVKISGEVN